MQRWKKVVARIFDVTHSDDSASVSIATASDDAFQFYSRVFPQDKLHVLLLLVVEVGAVLLHPVRPVDHENVFIGYILEDEEHCQACGAPRETRQQDHRRDQSSLQEVLPHHLEVVSRAVEVAARDYHHGHSSLSEYPDGCGDCLLDGHAVDGIENVRKLLSKRRIDEYLVRTFETGEVSFVKCIPSLYAALPSREPRIYLGIICAESIAVTEIDCDSLFKFEYDCRRKTCATHEVGEAFTFPYKENILHKTGYRGIDLPFLSEAVSV